MIRSIAISFLLVAVASSSAMAHTGAGSATGFVTGLTHPILGLDHLLAMVAVGLWAASMRGRAIWSLPAAFVGAMLVGGVLGIAWGGFPLVEVGILGSVVILGLAIASRVSPAPVFAAAVVGLLGVFHGHAHGTEMPLGASGVEYFAGFVVATVSLHLAGIGLGRVLDQAGWASALAPRLAGLSIALAGVGLAVS